MPKLPHSELVARAWILSIPGMLASVGMTLPGEILSWAEHGFYQLSLAGGRRDRDTPVARSLIQVDCFAANVGGAKPPWNAANQMAEVIIAQTYGGVDDAIPTARIVTLPSGYQQARVQTVEVTSEPRRMVGDEARIAHYSLDLIFTWVPVVA